MKKQIKYILLAFLTLVVTACSDDTLNFQKLEDSEQVIYKLVLNSDAGFKRPLSRGTNASQIPNTKVDEISAYVFERTGERRFLYAAQIAQHNGNLNEYTIALTNTRPGELIDVVLVANSSELLANTIKDGFNNYNQFITRLSYFASSLPSMTNVPMFGLYKGLSVVGGLNKNLTIQLMRSIAKFNVQISPDIDGGFSLEKVYLYNSSEEINVGYDIDLDGEPILPNARDIPLSTENKLMSTLVASHQKTESYPLAEMKNNQGFLILEGKYAGEATNTFYRLNLPEIKRNFNYVIQVTKLLSRGVASLNEAIESNDDTKYTTVVFDNLDISYAYYSKGDYFGSVSNTMFFSTGGAAENKELIISTEMTMDRLIFEFLRSNIKIDRVYKIKNLTKSVLGVTKIEKQLVENGDMLRIKDKQSGVVILEIFLKSK